MKNANLNPESARFPAPGVTPPRLGADVAVRQIVGLVQQADAVDEGLR